MVHNASIWHLYIKIITGYSGLGKATLTENPAPPGWGLGMGPIPPSHKKIVDYGNQKNYLLATTIALF